MPQTSQSVGGDGWLDGSWARSDRVRHCRQRSVVEGWEGLPDFAFQDLAAGLLQVGVSQVFMRGARLVSFRSSASLPMCLSSRLYRVLSLETDGWDHCVLPGVKGFLGFCEVKWGDEWVWLLLRAANGVVCALVFEWEMAVLATLNT